MNLHLSIMLTPLGLKLDLKGPKVAVNLHSNAFVAFRLWYSISTYSGSPSAGDPCTTSTDLANQIRQLSERLP